LLGIRTIVCVQKPPHHFSQTLHPLRMFKIVFRDSSLYPKQLPLFCLLRLISASADRVGYISNFCSMIELLYELKNSIFLTQKHSGIGYYIRRKKGKLNVCWTSTHNKNWKFSCVLHAHYPFLFSFARFDLANRGARQTVQPHTFYARRLAFDKTSAQHHFAAVNCSDAVMSVLLRCFNMQPDISAIMNCCVVALIVFSSDMLAWMADSLYSARACSRGGWG